MLATVNPAPAAISNTRVLLIPGVAAVVDPVLKAEGLFFTSIAAATGFSRTFTVEHFHVFRRVAFTGYSRRRHRGFDFQKVFIRKDKIDGTRGFV